MPDKESELDRIFYNELRGKTVTHDQASILEWAEKRLKPAILRSYLPRTSARSVEELEDVVHQVSNIPCLDMPYPRSNAKNTIYINGQIHMRNRAVGKLRQALNLPTRDGGGDDQAP